MIIRSGPIRKQHRNNPVLLTDRSLTIMKLFSLLSFLFLAIVVIACGSVGSNTPVATGSLSMTMQIPSTQSKHHAGIVSDIVLPSGELLETVSYTMTDGVNTYGPTTVDVSGSDPSVDVVGQTASWFIFGVVPAAAYEITITGSTNDLLETCTGTNPGFTVAPSTVTVVDVNVLCTVASTDAGAVQIVANADECPVYNWAVAKQVPNVPTDDMFTMSMDVTDIVDPTVTWINPNGNPNPAFPMGFSNQSLTAVGLHEYISQVSFTCGGYTGTGTLVGINFSITDANTAANPNCPTTDTTGTISFTCP